MVFTFIHIWNKGGVSRCRLAIYIQKKYLKEKRRIYGNSNILPCKNYIIFPQKNHLKENKNLSKYHNSVTNLKFQHKPTISSFENPHIKNRPIIIYYLGAYKNPLSYYTL
jgi:hypothetical protein